MRRGAPWTVERRRAVAWSLPWWVRWRWPCRHRRAVIGCGPASAAPQAETSYVPSGSSSWACGRGCPNACYAVRRPVRVRVSACPSVRVSNGGCAGVRSAGVRSAGVRSAGVRCPRLVSARLVSTSALSAPGQFVERRCGGAAPRAWDGPASAWSPAASASGPGCLPGLAVVVAGGGRAGRGSRLRSWPPSWAALRRRLHPGSTGWPTRASR
jgi:hypothetical protein